MTEAQDLRAELGRGSRFVAAELGTHGMAHGLDTLLEAAALLLDEADIAFLMVGDGAERVRLARLRAERGLHNVLMLQQQP